MARPRAQLAAAFTLVEALLASVILAMTVAAMTMPFVAGARSEQDDARRTLAVALAQEMMEEVLATDFHDDKEKYHYLVGPDHGEKDRSDFDNMDDYNGYAEPPGKITDLDGQVIQDPAATGLARFVTVAYVYVNGQDKGQPPTFLRVTVEIWHEGTPIVRLARLVHETPQ